jgi:serine/threonine-protein kinase HipA
MTFAKLAGITVAETRVVPLAGENALAVRRYDRDGARRIHCISAGTALRAQARLSRSRLPHVENGRFKR